MSLRTQLEKAVAGCMSYEMQHATFADGDATGDATGMQQTPANPHKQRVSDATEHATAMQPPAATDATAGPHGEKLHVALAKACNTQPSMQALLEAASKACDYWRDGPEAREQMRRDCLETPENLRADLLAHFKAAYGEAVRDSSTRAAAGLYPCGP